MQPTGKARRFKEIRNGSGESTTVRFPCQRTTSERVSGPCVVTQGLTHKNNTPKIPLNPLSHKLFVKKKNEKKFVNFLNALSKVKFEKNR